jgi:hypothetical protein
VKEELVTMLLDDVILARVDALARFYRVTRDEMLARILSTGIAALERHVREAQVRGSGERQ